MVLVDVQLNVEMLVWLCVNLLPSCVRCKVLEAVRPAGGSKPPSHADLCA